MIESDTRSMIPMAQINAKVSTIMESLVPLLEMAAKSPLSPEDCDPEEKRELLKNACHAFEMEGHGSQMNRLATGTGSVESSYNFVMGQKYFSHLQADNNYKRPADYFHEAERCGSTEAYLYLGLLYYNGLGVEGNLIEAFRYATLSFGRKGSKEIYKKRF